MRLSRVGFDQVIGFLEGGFNSWRKVSNEYDTVISISVSKFKNVKKWIVFDVRKEQEYLSEHILDAKNAPLNNFNNYLSEFPSQEIFYVHCASGYRSMIAASILKSRGIHNFIDITEGFDAIKKTEIKVSNYVCPSTL